MFKKLSDWYDSKKQVIYFGLIVFVLTMYYAPYLMNRPVTGKFEDSIQNRLVWSIKGECFFVRPYSNETVYLIRVQDCDKTEKVGK